MTDGGSTAKVTFALGDQSAEEFRSLALPTFFYRGGGTAPEMQDYLAANRIPHRRCDGSGHWPMIDRPPEAAAVAEYFAEHLLT